MPESTSSSASRFKNVSVPRWSAALIIALVIALVSVDAALLRHNELIGRALLRANRKMLPTVGLAVPPLLGVDLTGAARTISYGDDRRDTLMFVFSPDCPSSQRAWPHWLELAQRADPARVRLVYANIGPIIPATHRSRTPAIPRDSVVDADAESRVAYNLQVTPQILRISPEGRITDLWVGALDEKKEARLAQALAGRAPTLAMRQP